MSTRVYISALLVVVLIARCATALSLDTETDEYIQRFLAAIKERGYFSLNERTAHMLLPQNSRYKFDRRAAKLDGKPVWNLLWHNRSNTVSIEFASVDRDAARYSDLTLRLSGKSRDLVAAHVVSWLGIIDAEAAAALRERTTSTSGEIFLQKQLGTSEKPFAIASAVRRNGRAWGAALQLMEGPLPITGITRE
jgi:hypothetical protein